MIFNGKTSLISPKLTESRRHAQFYLRGCLLQTIMTFYEENYGQIELNL